ncbi:MAG TPA: hypothetical protein VK928_02205 [Longimicrobiales bacterium]|nr:hypothetical protein [Longimicrobiales bacterium]
MPATTPHEANRLYWETDESVAGIAQRLELSRRALYDAVQPLPAGRDCPDCGKPLVYENRSGRNSDNAVCLHCDVEGEEIEPEAGPEADPSEPGIDEDLMRVGGAALAGAAIGSLITLLIVRRR